MSHVGDREVLGVRVFNAGDTHRFGHVHRGAHLTADERDDIYTVLAYSPNLRNVAAKTVRRAPFKLKVLNAISTVLYPARKVLADRQVAIGLIFS